MKPAFYLDIRLARQLDVPGWEIVGRVWHLVHRVAARCRIPFAVAFPNYMKNGYGLGEVLRVFVETKEDGDALREGLLATDCMDYGTVGRIEGVSGMVERYEAYLMHRIPSGISNRDDPTATRRLELQNQAKRRRLAQQAGLPFVRMRSSSGNRFRLVFERIAVSREQSGSPNGYGLSRAKQIVALPVL